ncbi:MAG: DNA polymerase II [Alphaproteobacteria bacterium]
MPAVTRTAERGFVLQPTWQSVDGRSLVRLFGRLESGKAFLVEDDRFRPFLYVRASDVDRLRDEGGIAAVEVDGRRDLAGAPVARVRPVDPGSLPRLRARLESAGVATFEGDLRPAYRYLVESGLRAGVEIEGRSFVSPDDPDLLVFPNPRLAPAEVRFSPRTLSLDVETTPDASEVFAIALVGCGVEEVHLSSTTPVEGAVVHADERELLRALVLAVRRLDPDVIVGWNVVDFDLRVLARRAARLRVPLDLGREPGVPRFEQDSGYTRTSRVEIPGRMVLDGIGLVRDALRLPDYRLDTVARAVLGRGKRIDPDVPDAAAEIQRLRREDPGALVAYNREDARLVVEVLESEGLLDLAVERSRLSGMQLDRVGASIASFDLLYLPELHRCGIVAPNVKADRTDAVVQGGAVLEPRPGLFRDVAVYDFKSLYPSLIRTFQLDPLAHARATASPGSDAIEAPNGARFAREGGILPGIVERFLASRDAAKARGDRHADQAIKIMMNALFGVLGASACRFFDPEIANAITGFGQRTLSWTREAIEGFGYTVLYGDTDSVFVHLHGGAEGGAVAEAMALRARVEQAIVERIRAEHGVEPRLVLELEHVLERFFLPRVRGGAGGSKKRYAGRVDGRLLVVGLESVRRDWPAVARRLQEGMLERIFDDRDPAPFVAEVVARLRAGELDEELVWTKRVRKGSLEGYAQAAPHVQAARKAGGTRGGVIRWVVTRAGPEPVLPGRPLPDRIDREHYVTRVLEPVAEAIFAECGGSFGEAIGRPKQLALL